MGFRFTIGRKILVGFGVLIFLVLLAFSLTLITIRKSREINDKITNLYNPSVSALQDMYVLVLQSNTLINNWINTPASSSDKPKLKFLIKFDYPSQRRIIDTLSKGWSQADRQLCDSIFNDCDRLWVLDREVMVNLDNVDGYNDASIFLLCQSDVLDNDGVIKVKINTILNNLNNLIGIQNEAAQKKRNEMLASFKTLSMAVMLLLIVLPLGGLLIAFLTARTITKPIKILKNVLLSMARGVLPEAQKIESNDEVGEMSVALNSLVDSMKLTTEFAGEVGSGNFESYYQLLSEQDTLGQALLKMRGELRENERVLEAKVVERTEQVVRQKEEIELQNQKLEIVYKHITDSIRYAKRLQDAILPPLSFVKRILPESFILFKPKDIVSGDFYWLFENKNRIYLAAVDCTGHGVPGAFMSIVGNNMLNQIVKENPEINAGQLLDELNIMAGKTINQNADETAVRDGMDMTLCILDTDTKIMDMAGANNSLYHYRNSVLKEYKADKIPIGFAEGNSKHFTNHRIALEKGDTIYLYTDGYADQFGGPKGKKFMVEKFRTFLNTIHPLPLLEQYLKLDSSLESWKGDLEQVDDILVIGFRVN